MEATTWRRVVGGKNTTKQKTHKLHRESERQRRRLPALPGRGSAEHGGELRGHTRGVAEASKPAGRVAGVGCVVIDPPTPLLGTPATCGGALR